MWKTFNGFHKCSSNLRITNFGFCSSVLCCFVCAWHRLKPFHKEPELILFDLIARTRNRLYVCDRWSWSWSNLKSNKKNIWYFRLFFFFHLISFSDFLLYLLHRTLFTLPVPRIEYRIVYVHCLWGWYSPTTSF